MKLSIITINKNNAIGLRKTMQSVISQSWQDYEYIIIDGASTDGSLNVINELAGCITYWSSESDRGVYHAMNKGIKKSNGDYLLFLNSGDFLVSEDVLKSIFETKNYEADILCARCNVSKDGVVVWTSNPPEQVTFGSLYNEGLAHQSTFIKRDLFAKYGMYREDFKYNSDIEFWYRTIILNNASTEKIEVISTDYNLDGISELHKNDRQFQEEHRIIMSHPFFQKVIPDYNQWREDKNLLSEFKWIKSHHFLCLILRFLRKADKRLNK